MQMYHDASCLCVFVLTKHLLVAENSDLNRHSHRLWLMGWSDGFCLSRALPKELSTCPVWNICVGIPSYPTASRNSTAYISNWKGFQETSSQRCQPGQGQRYGTKRPWRGSVGSWMGILGVGRFFPGEDTEAIMYFDFLLPRLKEAYPDARLSVPDNLTSDGWSGIHEKSVHRSFDASDGLNLEHNSKHP